VRGAVGASLSSPSLILGCRRDGVLKTAPAQQRYRATAAASPFSMGASTRLPHSVHEPS
jgi:hypothetical protein